MNGFEADKDFHRDLAIELNNQTWGLLGKPDRSEKDDRRMVRIAQGSLYHWQKSQGHTPLHDQRGHWLLSRVFAVLGKAEEAAAHAGICLKLTEENGFVDFDRAYALEGLARAAACAGDKEAAQAHYRRAEAAAEQIAKDEDRNLFLSDLRGEPWFGLRD